MGEIQLKRRENFTQQSKHGPHVAFASFAKELHSAIDSMQLDQVIERITE